ncbi:MAG: FG-GAP repeat protein [Deltaproteobacteria bacterium]|nr:FG-GAP repeat protein [Deltaproteobacteria bacterium]
MDVLGTRTAPGAELRPGVHFWRLYGRLGGFVGERPGPVWQFWVGARSAPVDTSWGTVSDFNGDGYADVVVGAPLAAPGGRTFAGLVMIYEGSASGPGASPHRVLEGPAANQIFGFSVASAGDVNGDGYSDLVVGSPNASPGGRGGAGTVSVFQGGATGLAVSPSLVLEGSVAYDNLGVAVAAAGDVNGDGFSDVIAGADRDAPDGRTQAGSVRVYLGGSGGLSTSPRWAFGGPTAGDFLGNAVSGAGDFNGDGYADVVVGAPKASPMGRSEAGSVRVFLGSPFGVAGSPQIVLDGTSPGDEFGRSIAGTGDLNGDGISDLVIGAPRASRGGRSLVGTVSVFLGSVRGISSIPQNVTEGSLAGFGLGGAVGNAGDCNGDGFSDVIIGARSASPGGRMAAGTAILYLGSSVGVAGSPARTLDGAGTEDGFGADVGNCGDSNGDGLSDIVIGAPGASPGGRNRAGTASVFLGAGGGLVGSPSRVIEGAQARDALGLSVAGM